MAQLTNAILIEVLTKAPARTKPPEGVPEALYMSRL